MLLDAAGLFLAVVYFLVLRWSIPDALGFLTQADAFILKLLILPAAVGCLLNRGCAFLVASAFGYPFAYSPVRRPAPKASRSDIQSNSLR